MQSQPAAVATVGALIFAGSCWLRSIVTVRRSAFKAWTEPRLEFGTVDGSEQLA
jgi:hypothetical protein